MASRARSTEAGKVRTVVTWASPGARCSVRSTSAARRMSDGSMYRARDLPDALDRLLMLHRPVQGHCGERGIGQQDVLARRDRVLQQAVREDQVAADEVIAPGDALAHIRATMDDELESEGADGRARPARTGRREGHEAEPAMELDELHLKEIDESGGLLIAQPEHCIALDLRDGQAARRALAERAEKLAEDFARVVELRRRDEFRIA
jgi:hypothetical protein